VEEEALQVLEAWDSFGNKMMNEEGKGKKARWGNKVACELGNILDKAEEKPYVFTVT
jgi:hypothetical protein